jgi:hypothetical protein
VTTTLMRGEFGRRKAGGAQGIRSQPKDDMWKDVGTTSRGLGGLNHLPAFRLLVGPSTKEKVMKKRILTIVCGILFFATSGYSLGAPNDTASKNDCLVYHLNCPTQYRQDSLPERIEKLKLEIQKGEDVYTAGKQKLSQTILKEAGAELASLKKGGK